eukprot:gene32455-40056_t
MSVYAQLRSKPDSTPHEIEEALDGNLCRCTGYRPILDAARSLSNNKGPSVGGCCGGGGGGGCPCKEPLPNDDNEQNEDKTSSGCCGSDKTTCCNSVVGQSHNCSEQYIADGKGVQAEMTAKGLSEPIFPPFLMTYKPSTLCVTKGKVTWHQPLTMSHLLELKTILPEARLVVGNTEVGIETKFKAMEYSHLINPTKVQELHVLSSTDGGVTVGAAVTINKFRSYLIELSDKLTSQGEAHTTRGLLAIHDMLGWFASNQIRNVACIGGNIVTASPISDLNPMLLACNVVLNVRSSARGVRQVAMSKFFLAYRKVDLQPDEILESVFIPFTSQFEFVLPFKQARRREDDISIVTSGIRVRLEPQGRTHWIVADCALAYGGM